MSRKPKFKIGDKVTILDGKDISDYTGGWAGDMRPLVGQTATIDAVSPYPGDRIGYYLKGDKDASGFVWDERGLELVETKPEKIIIYRCGRSVFAKDLVRRTIAEAKCSPEDTFDFYKGAQLALDRLMHQSITQPPKYYTGKLVCIQSSSRWWTVGKVYNAVDGVIHDDDGDGRGPHRSVESFNQGMHPFCKFAELKE